MSKGVGMHVTDSRPLLRDTDEVILLHHLAFGDGIPPDEPLGCKYYVVI